MSPLSRTRPLVPLFVTLVLAGLYGLSWTHAQGVPATPAPGGFLETATSTTVRPGYTAADLQALVPNRGTFTFPAPYNTTGIRLTNASDCGGADCVDYVGYSYWRNMNNSAGSNVLYAFVGLNRGRGGAGPSLFRYDKTTGETVNLGPLFSAGDFQGSATGEGWYFSATQPTTLYIPDGQQLRRYDVLTHASTVVFDIADQLGADKYLFQVHSSNDDRVHSFTLKRASDFAELGCATYREDTQQFNYFPAHGFYDECQIDKSGHWLLIKEDVDGKDEVDNRIINLDTGVETVLLDPDGAGGHSDNGFGVMIAADNHHPLPNAIRLWTFGPTPLLPGPVVYRDPQWIPQSMQHLSFANARSAPLNQQYACGSAVNRTAGPRANEVVCFRLDGSLSALVVAPVMTDLDANGGGSDDYAKDPKGNLDPTGQYFIWTTNLMDGRLDAFIVRVPSQVLVPLDPSADLTAPTASITAPAQASTVSGDVPLTATAADNVGVAGVQFQLDGVSLGTEILTVPFAWTWHTPSTTDGVHALTAVARDAAGNVTISPSVAVTVLNAPAGPQISGLAAVSLTGTAAVITWSTNQLADSLVDYGLTNTYGSATPLEATLVPVHVRTLSSLTPNTTYHYRVTSKNGQGIAATSADATFTTLPPALITGIAVPAIGPTSATIAWTTDLPADSSVQYGPTASYGLTQYGNGSFDTSHALGLSGLVPGATYHFRVHAITQDGVESFSSDGTFTTPFFLITNVATSAVTSSSAVVSWNTSVAASSQVEYGLTTAYGSATTLDAALVSGHSQSLVGLVHSSTYHYRVRSINVQAQLVTSGDLTFATPAGVLVSNVTVFNIQGAAAAVNWASDQPADTQIEYGLTTAYGTLTTLNTALVTSHGQAVNAGLVPGTMYHFRVRSRNAIGLLGTSVDATFTTAPAAVISAVTVASVAGTSATITWTTDLPTNSRIEYGLTASYGASTTLDPALVTSHSHTITGLTPGATYVYLVRATTAQNALTKLGGFTVTTLTVPAISGVTATAMTATSATISWTTTQPADSQVDYGVTTAYGSTTSLDATLVTAHGQGLTGLASVTTYHYRVRSANGGGQSTSGDVTFTTPEPPPVISNVAASAITTSTATITWTTDRPASAVVDYGLTSAYDSLTIAPGGAVTAHSVGLVGLTAGTTYHYGVKSGAAGGWTQSADATFTTPSQPPPVISNVVVSAIATTSATVGWTTDRAADSQIEYGLTAAYGSATTLDAASVTAHSQALAGLTGGMTYHYRVRSAINGAVMTSVDATFTLLVPAPVVSNVQASAMTTTSAMIGWTTDRASSSQVEFGLTTAYGNTTSLDATPVLAHSQSLGALSPGTTYHYRVKSGTNGGLTTSGDATFATLFVPPTMSGVAPSAVASTTATIAWTTDQPTDSQVEYGLTTAYGSATTLDGALVTTHSQTLTGLASGALYHYRVTSRNGAGLLATSADGTFTTTTTGVLVSNVTVSSIQGASATVMWSTDQPADTQVEYGLTTAYGTLTTLNSSLVTSHGQAVNAGLVPGTTYHFRVRSRNAAGLIGTSADATFTTAPAAIISGVSVAAVTGTTATIIWTTDLPANSRIEYGLTASYGSSTTLDPALVTAHSHTITGLTAGATYFYLVRSITAQNALTKVGGFTVNTATPPVISNVLATGVSDTTATITWLTNNQTDSQVEYGPTTAYGTATAVNPALVTSHSQVLTGLTASTLYHFRVKSRDSAGTLAMSADVGVATLPTPVISGVGASALTGTSALITWTTNLASNSRVEFGLTSAYGSVTAVDPALVTSHSQSITGLTPGTTYFYRVRSVTAQGVTVELGGFTVTTVAAPIISGVAASTTTDTATVSWATDQASDSQVLYGLTTTYGSTTALASALVTTHGQALTGLTPATLYHYRVQSRNSVGVLAASEDNTFTTAGGVVISNVVISNIQGASAAVNWTTDQPSDTQIEYGLTTSYGTTTTLNAALVTGHGQGMSAGLVPGTTYHLRVRSRSAAGQLGVSSDRTVTTAPAPVISAVGVASVTGTSATIAWMTDLPANSKIEYGLTGSYGLTTTLDPALVTSHSHTISGLSAGTTYYYLVRSVTAQNALAKIGGFTVTTSSAPVISNIASSGITATTATITWTTNQAADSLVEYGTTTAYGATTANDPTLVTSHGQGLSGLTAGTLYHARVTSANAGAQTTVSADVTFTTAGPFVLSAITASGITGTAATISWTTDQPSSSVVEYGTTTAYGSTSSDPAMVTSHSRFLSGLANGTTYHYRVSSTNGSGLTSTSADVTFTTVAAALISGVSSSAITPTDATIAWTTDQASSTRIEYGPTTGYGTFTTLDSSLVTAHAQSLPGLSIGTLYHYRVYSQNAVGIMAISGDFTFTTVGPPFVSTNTGGSLSNTTITFQWTTSQPATSQIEYGPTTAFGSFSALDSTLATSHEQTLTGLTPGATYFYRFRGTNGFGLTGFSTGSVFSMPALPLISGVATSGITEVAATISWATDQRTDARTEYGLTTAYGSSTALDPALNYQHAQTLAGLAPATTYHYRVLSANSDGLLGTSADGVFTTATPPAPAISAVSPSAVTGVSATITWTTDLASSTQIEYGTTNAYGSLTTLDAALVTAHAQGLAGLTPGTLYHYRVRSVSGLGAAAISGDFTFTTVGPPVMQGVVGNVSGTTATFQWTTDQPATTQIEYGLTTALGTSTTLDPALVTSHQQALAGLTAGATYFYRVRGANNLGMTGLSNISAFTLTAPPAAIFNITISNIQGAAAAINWFTDQPTDTQIDYGLTTAYGSVTTLNTALATSHGQAVNSGLVPATTYHFRIRARNAAGVLGTSADATFTTAPAPVISAVAVGAVTSTSATITWTTDLAANSKIEYGLTASYGSSTTLDPALVTSHSQTITGLAPGTTYYFLIRSTTGANALTKVGGFTVTTAAAPVVPSGDAPDRLTPKVP